MRWAAPPGCPGPDALLARVAALLGGPLPATAPPLSVAIAPRGDRLAARIEVGQLDGDEGLVRVLTSASCATLVEAAAVVVARAVREQAASPTAGLEWVPPPLVTPTPIPPPPAAPRDRAAVLGPPASAPKFGVTARASALSGIGAVPRVGLGAELTLVARRRATVAEVGLARWGDGAVQGQDATRIGLEAGVLRLGWRPDGSFLRGWVVGELGQLGAAPTPLRPTLARARWSALGTGLGVVWPFAAHAAVVGSVEFLVPLERASFVQGDGTLVYRPGVLVSHANLGLEIGWR